jgi:N-dimethylarginine dimethylaminohydrolase
MSLPLWLSADIANNACMEEIPAHRRRVNQARAVEQFRSLYRELTRSGLVYLLPSAPWLQDQPYVSNLALPLEHREDRAVIVSRFRPPSRRGETPIGAAFFKSMNMPVHVPPSRIGRQPVFFEGQADVKHIAGNVYVGAHGMRTSLNALDWAAKQFDMEILPFAIGDPHLYHLDCCLFKASSSCVLLCTDVGTRDEIRQIERHCEILDISRAQARAGVTNSLLVGHDILCDSELSLMERHNPAYAVEKSKIELLERVSERFGLNLKILCMSEFYKSGAMLSCLVLRLN